jgi:hypothetical protein
MLPPVQRFLPGVVSWLARVGMRRPELMARMKHVALQQLNSSQPDLD